MTFQGVDENFLGSNFINQPVLSVNSTRPKARKIMFETLRFTQPMERSILN